MASSKRPPTKKKASTKTGKKAKPGGRRPAKKKSGPKTKAKTRQKKAPQGLLERLLARTEARAGQGRKRSAKGRNSKILGVKPQTLQIMYGVGLGLILAGVILWLMWSGPNGSPSPETGPPAKQTAKRAAKQTAPPSQPAPRAKPAPRPQSAPARPVYEEERPAFQRHLALTDATILAALKSLGISDKAVRFSRVVNVVEAGVHFERAEMGLDIKGLSPEKVEEGLLAAFARLDFPVTLNSGERTARLDTLEIKLDGRLTHTLRLNHLPPPAPTKTAAGKRPKAAIIIDDLGYHAKLDSRFAALKLPLNLAILPLSPSGRRLAQAARKADREVILHFPMEPHGYPKVNPGPGTVLTGMGPEKIRGMLKSALDFLPQAKGLNNHMGSRFTEDSGRLKFLLGELKRRGLYFVDSRTSPRSKGRAAAAEVGIRFGERSIFLDNLATETAVKAQLRRFIARAGSNGTAIAIGHPHPQTLRALTELSPELSAGLNLVKASRIVK